MSKGILAHYLALPLADRRAIEARLDRETRAALKAAIEKSSDDKVIATPVASPIDLKPFSPWLRRHLGQCLAEAAATTQTPQAQAALRLVLEQKRLAQ